MADVTPQKSPQVAWNEDEQLIRRLVKETLLQMSGPSGFKKHYERVLELVKYKVLSTYSDRWPRGYINGMDVRRAPRLLLTDQIDFVVGGFVEGERARLWREYTPLVVSKLLEALPAAARPFESYYEFSLPKFVFRKLYAEFPEGRSTDEIEELLKQHVKEVVAKEIPKLTNDTGELRDEELVHVATFGDVQILRDEELVHAATFGDVQILKARRVQLIEGDSPGREAARDLLMERYSPKIKKLVAGIVYKRGLCPPSQDAPSFIEDAAQNVCLKIMAKLRSYNFEQPFEHWVAKICSNESIARRRDEVGKKPDDPRVYVSWEEFLQQAPAPVIDEHLDILKKMINAYIKQGARAKKSWRAIRLKSFEDLAVKEIAVRLKTTEDYVYKMFSHDYRELRRIGIDDFGISGTDL